MQPKAAVLILALLLPLPAVATVPMPKVVETKCALCHGKLGEAGSDELAVLAGQSEKYLAKQLKDFLSGKRKDTTMARMARGLSEADIEALSRYYAAQKPPPHKMTDADLHGAGRFLFQKGSLAPGAPSCQMCHGEKALGTDNAPRLAGQHAPYLERQLREFSQRERTNDNEVMHTVAAKLSPFDIKARAEYLATLE
jgi:cytochrome c553